jgi:outer membrane biosynthesis protein TonB
MFVRRLLFIVVFCSAFASFCGCADQKTKSQSVAASAAPMNLYNADAKPNANSQFSFEGTPDNHFNYSRPKQCADDESMLMTEQQLRTRIYRWTSPFKPSKGQEFHPAAAIAYPDRMIFPQEALAKGLTKGDVTVAIFVDEKGSVVSVLPLCATDQVFVDSAIESGYRYKMRAANWDGVGIHSIAIEHFIFHYTH